MATTETPTSRIPKLTLGRRLCMAREDAGLSQADMAEILEVSPATISNYENGLRQPRIGEFELVKRWAYETGVPEDWLAGFRNGWLPPDAPDELPPFEPMGRQITHSATGATHRDAA